MKVAVSGGGTGGHTLPVIAVIKALNELNENVEIIFIGSKFGIESRLIPKMGVKYFGISAGKFRRYHRSTILNIIDPTTLFKNIKDLFEFVKGIKESKDILSFEKPDVVFAKGGYVSFPVGLAARFLKTPLVIHESDFIMGLANRKMSSFSEKICISFPAKNYPEVESEKMEFTGNPIRGDIKGGSKENLLAKLGFDKNRKTVLVLGGSQGSRFINEQIIKILEGLLSDHQLLWVTGEKDADWVKYEIKKNLPKELKSYVKVFGFVTTELADLYAASDLVISRAGSNTLFELAALGKPGILIPLESSTGAHQYENAKYFSRNGAAYIFRETNFDPKKLLKHINFLFGNPGELGKMSEIIKELSRENAAGAVARVIYKVGEKNIEQNRTLKGKEK